MILDAKPGARRWLAAACTAGAIGVVVLACQTPEPQSPEVAVREALGIVPEPPPPPPAPSEIGAGPFEARNTVKGDTRGFAEIVDEHAGMPSPTPGQRAHADLHRKGRLIVDEKVRMPPPPPPPPVRVR